MTFEYYDENEFKAFIHKLPDKDRYKLLLIIINIEKYGLITAFKMKWVKKIGNNLYEIRSRRTNNYQRCLYFHIFRDKYMITNYFTKKTNKTLVKEIHKAIGRRDRFERRHKID